MFLPSPNDRLPSLRRIRYQDNLAMSTETIMAGSTISALAQQPSLSCQQYVDNVGGNFPMDEAVLSSMYNADEILPSHVDTPAVFPPGSVVLSAESHGLSTWTRTGCITVKLPSGDLKRYFIKVRVPYSPP